MLLVVEGMKNNKSTLTDNLVVSFTLDLRQKAEKWLVVSSSKSKRILTVQSSNCIYLKELKLALKVLQLTIKATNIYIYITSRHLTVYLFVCVYIYVCVFYMYVCMTYSYTHISWYRYITEIYMIQHISIVYIVYMSQKSHI